MFQEYIPTGVDIRLTLFGEHIFAVSIAAGSGRFPADSRIDLSVPIAEHHLDDATREKLQALMSILALDYATIDLRLSPEGEYVFLDVNPGGQYLFTELLSGLPITEQLVDFLLE